MTHLITLSLLFFLFASCKDSSSPTVSPKITAEQLAFAGRAMNLEFPAETRGILYHRAKDSEGFLPTPDDAIHLKIELPATALAKFLAQAPLASAKWQNSTPQINDVPNWPEWQPSKVQKFRTEQFSLPNAKALNILIDDDKDTKVVYLQWFEM